MSRTIWALGLVGMTIASACASVTEAPGPGGIASPAGSCGGAGFTHAGQLVGLRRAESGRFGGIVVEVTATHVTVDLGDDLVALDFGLDLRARFSAGESVSVELVDDASYPVASSMVILHGLTARAVLAAASTSGFSIHEWAWLSVPEGPQIGAGEAVCQSGSRERTECGVSHRLSTANGIEVSVDGASIELSPGERGEIAGWMVEGDAGSWSATPASSDYCVVEGGGSTRLVARLVGPPSAEPPPTGDEPPVEVTDPAGAARVPQCGERAGSDGRPEIGLEAAPRGRAHAVVTNVSATTAGFDTASGHVVLRWHGSDLRDHLTEGESVELEHRWVDGVGLSFVWSGRAALAAAEANGVWGVDLDGLRVSMGAAVCHSNACDHAFTSLEHEVLVADSALLPGESLDVDGLRVDVIAASTSWSDRPGALDGDLCAYDEMGESRRIELYVTSARAL